MNLDRTFRKILTVIATFGILLAIFKGSTIVKAQAQNGTTLSATKTATGHLTRTFHWTINKSVTPANWDLFNGDTGTSDYTVSVTKDEGTDSGAFVDGQVCVTNGGSVATENLAINDVIQTKTGPGAFQDYLSTPLDLSSNPILDPGESNCYPYSIPFTPVPNAQYKNVAEITITNHSGSLGTPFGPDPKVEFSLPVTPTLVNDSVNVDDTNGQTWTFSNSGEQNYSRIFACEKDKGVYDNTATIRETGQSASASVSVNCFDPTVTKTANTNFDRNYLWNLVKSGDKSSLTLALGQTALVNYTVTASATSQDSNWGVTGTISVENPAPIPATINSVSDLLSGGATGIVDCGVSFPYVIAAESTLECTYSASLPGANNQINSATANQQNYSYDSSGNPSENGTTDYTGTANVDFSTAKINETDKCITVTDTLGGVLGTVCFADQPKTFNYSYTVGPLSTCGNTNVANTASFVTNDTSSTGSSSWNVGVSVPCQPTRTLGFWQTHTIFTSSIFAGSAMQRFIGFNAAPFAGSHKGTITNTQAAGQSQLFGAFYANIAKTSSGGKRLAIDQARMQLLQQLLAAKLNCAAFGCPASTLSLISSADAAYQSGPAATILSYANQLDAYNNSQDSVPTSLPVGSATPLISQNFANIIFWNSP